MKKKALAFFASLVIILGCATTAAQAQSAKPKPTPKPSPAEVKISVAYSAFEEPKTKDTEITGERLILFEIDFFAKKKTSRQLKADLLLAGLKIVAIRSNGILVSYPSAMDDCHILGDARTAAKIVAKHLGKEYEAKFSLANLQEFYQSFPEDQCKGIIGAALPPGVAALFSFKSMDGII